jgi:hypothetical protein
MLTRLSPREKAGRHLSLGYADLHAVREGRAMTAALVTGSGLRLRTAPGGEVIASLPKNARVEAFETAGGWTRVEFADQGQVRRGWVSAQFLAQAVAPPAAPAFTPPAPPMADDEAHRVSVVGDQAIAPDGRVFARKFKAGFYTLGKTPLADWLADTPAPADLSPSVVRVVRAVSLNEGKLEAVNSYDNCYLSFGLFQWTSGAGTEPGELAALIARVKQAAPAAYDDCFGRYGLDAKLPSPAATTGRLTLKGVDLAGPLQKQQLRGADWAYRFWRAGHHHQVRAAALVHAAARIRRFLDLPVAGHPLRQWLSSEYGIAMVLDEHVNRPGHVPGTLAKAVAAAGAAAPKGAQEPALVLAYEAARAKTTMTDPRLRAQRLAECVHDGVLSSEPGSFNL